MPENINSTKLNLLGDQRNVLVNHSAERLPAWISVQDRLLAAALESGIFKPTDTYDTVIFTELAGYQLKD